MNIILKYIQHHPDVVDDLLNSLDDVLHEKDPVHGGLPLDDKTRARMHTSVREWVMKFFGDANPRR